MKKSLFPQTKVKNKEPKINDPDWLIWAGWSDRITFEEIFEKTGKSEKEVISYMRANLKSSSFKLWRKRIRNKSIKHRKVFVAKRKELRRNNFKLDFDY